LSDASRVTQHPQYDDFELWNDIVILRLQNNLVFGSTIRPTVLPSPTHDVSEFYLKFSLSLKYIFRFHLDQLVLYLAGEIWHQVQQHTQIFFIVSQFHR
jgi:Trypsin